MHDIARPAEVKPISWLSKRKQNELIMEVLMPEIKRFLFFLHPDFAPSASGYWENEEEGWRVGPNGQVYDLTQDSSWTGNLITLWVYYRHPKWLDDRNYIRSAKRLRQAYIEILEWRIAEEGKPEPLMPWEAEEKAVNEERRIVFFALDLPERGWVRGSALRLYRVIREVYSEWNSPEIWQNLGNHYPHFVSKETFTEMLEHWAGVCGHTYMRGKRRHKKAGQRITLNDDGVIGLYAFRVEKLPWRNGVQYKITRIDTDTETQPAPLPVSFPISRERLEEWRREVIAAGKLDREAA